MRVLKRTVAVALLLVAGSCLAADPAERALEQANMLVERMKAFDAEGVAALTYTRFFERKGVDPARARKAAAAMTDRLKSVGTVYSRFDLLPPEKAFMGDGQVYIIIPYAHIMEAGGRRILTEAFLIGVSEDQGQHWTFLDGIAMTQENVREVIPSYPGTPLPPRRVQRLD